MDKYGKNNFVDVYFILSEAPLDGKVFPPERQAEIDGVKNEKLKKAKITSWSLLKVAIENTFSEKIENVNFSKAENGKWTADKFSFSITHTDGFVAVAVSLNGCGVDVEKRDAFYKKCADKPFIDSFSKKIGVLSTDKEVLLKAWTAKESAYKAAGEGSFISSNAYEKSFPVKHYLFDDYVIAVSSKGDIAPSFYKVTADGRILGEKLKCI